MEFDAIEEGREEEILLRALRGAILEVFRRRLSGFDFSPIRTFPEGLIVLPVVSAFVTSSGDIL